MKPIYFPSLKGNMGDWSFYPCLMKLRDIAERVSLAKEIHPSEQLHELIQRELKSSRTEQIKKYLLSNEQRFFNSLIIAVYDGNPQWFQLKDVSGPANFKEDDVPESVISSLGILMFNGKEKLFALDGQHRLMGIKESVKKSSSLGDEELSVIFVAHHQTPSGIQRSRRLFTALNRNAKPVTKGEIIALDEDDLVAILVRRLVTEHEMFKDKRTDFSGGASLPKSNQESLTSIVNLYDVLTIYFQNIKGLSHSDLRDNRPSDSALKSKYDDVCKLVKGLEKSFPPLKEFRRAESTEEVVKKYRHPNGGNILFRPIGLTIALSLLAAVVKDGKSLAAALRLISGIPQEISDVPYRSVIWHPTKKTVVNKGQKLAISLLEYMLGLKVDEEKLKAEYAKALEKSDAKLPDKIV